VGWPLGGYLWDTLHLAQGRLPLAKEKEAVLLGQAAAAALKKKVGDVLLVRDRTFIIVGTFRLGGVMGNNSLILPLETMQEMTNRRGKVTGFFIRIDHPEDPSRIKEVRASLERAFPVLSILETNIYMADGCQEKTAPIDRKEGKRDPSKK
jgi:ABC-type lipoprotein release transport system permease subunit